MDDRFLFCFDGSHDNDRYRDLATERGFAVFAGRELRLGAAGWKPDAIRVVMEDGGQRCTLAIIELEADVNTARISARKYLPEPSQSVVDAFLAYLDTYAAHCRRHADPRLATIQALKDMLSECETLIVTAGCQRDRFASVEELPLIDQGHRARPQQTDAVPRTSRSFRWSGKVTLSPEQQKHLFRTVLVLDAIVRGWDKSGASLAKWRNLRTQPLKAQLEAQPGNSPALRALILGHKLGVQIDIDHLAVELAGIWTSMSAKQYTPESVVHVLQQYLPIAAKLPNSIPVQEAFEKARPLLE
jgi:hypothetical protein